VNFDVLSEPEEQELIKALLDFPAVVESAAETLEPQRVATYLLENCAARSPVVSQASRSRAG